MKKNLEVGRGWHESREGQVTSVPNTTLAFPFWSQHGCSDSPHERPVVWDGASEVSQGRPLSASSQHYVLRDGQVFPLFHPLPHLIYKLQLSDSLFLGILWLDYYNLFHNLFLRFNVCVKFYKVMHDSYLDKAYLRAHLVIFSCVF